jgi:protein-tyrosine phosphatase
MPSVLFVCTANRFRSPLAAAFLRKNLEELGMSGSWHVSSAGTWAAPGLPVMPGIAEAARDFGIELSTHQSVRVNRHILSKYDLILVMEASQKEALVTEDPGLRERVYPLSEVTERRSYDIPDALGSAQEMRAVVAELDTLIRQGLESICVLATYLNNSRNQAKPRHG